MQEEKIIDFVGWRRVATIASMLMIIASLLSISVNGLKLGLDFTGGAELEVRFEQPVDLQAVRDTLTAAGYEQAVVLNFGAETDVLVRLPQQAADDAAAQQLTDSLLNTLQKKFSGSITLLSVSIVGPQVGDDLRDQGGLALIIALAGVMLYVAVRFQYKFAVGAVIALIHDVIITVGLFSFFQWNFDLTVLAAMLALIGYSLNDTIVVFDRIRENFRKLRKSTPIEIVNVSLTQTLSRTIVTGLTTLLVLVALGLFGGETLRGFSLALIIGIIVGTYSSVYIASSVTLYMNISSADLARPEKGAAGVDDGLP